MAFCTNCGATVQGAFCPQCGTPAKSASAAAPSTGAPAAENPVAQPAAPAAPPYQAPAISTPYDPAPVKRKTSPIVWILLAVAGIVVLGIVCLIGAGMYIAKNPGMVMAKLITASNPDAEVLSTDLGSQTVRIRDRKTGEEVTLSFDDIKNGKLHFSTRGKNGEVATAEIGGGVGNLPSWVPIYPGAKAQGNITGTGDSASGGGAGGMVTFTTTDSPVKARDFYEAKFKELHMTVELAESSDEGAIETGTDPGSKRSLHIVVAGGNGSETTIMVTYGQEK